METDVSIAIQKKVQDIDHGEKGMSGSFEILFCQDFCLSSLTALWSPRHRSLAMEGHGFAKAAQG